MTKANADTLKDINLLDQACERILSLSRKTKRSVLDNLFIGIREYSYETQEHGERMAQLAQQIGKQMGLSDIQNNDLALLAKAHDLGKILIPGRILTKTGPLSDEEWVEMKKHPIYGYKLALMIPDIRHVADGILFHHERWDGQGYPHRMIGLAIPLSARILSVVDAYDVMTHDRIYRQPMSSQDALDEMQKNAGKQFDPEIVDLFARYIQI
jgi:HD-GYP domain-containing protein (c-di-GMP phosphodiesterase class II)